MLSGGRRENPQGHPHEVRFSVFASAHSLGAITREEEPEYFDRPSGGCPRCMMEISRFSAVAHVLPMLLPDVKLPADLLDKFLFSLRLARIAGSVQRTPANGTPAEPSVADGTGEEFTEPRYTREAAGRVPVRGRAAQVTVELTGAAAGWRTVCPANRVTPASASGGARC